MAETARTLDASPGSPDHRRPPSRPATRGVTGDGAGWSGTDGRGPRQHRAPRRHAPPEPADSGSETPEAVGPSDGVDTGMSPARGGPSPVPLLVHITRPRNPLDSGPDASNTPSMDPLVVGLAQLVRDRWAAEQRERAAQRTRLAVVEGRRDATAPRRS